MEYKFKALYDGSLIPCIPVESNNLILRIVFSPEFLKIGRLREETGWREDLPVLPIFQYTGKKDRNGEEIYCGHMLKYRNTSNIFIVKWIDALSGFGLIFKGESEFRNILLEDIFYEIIGHEAIK